MHHLNPKFQYNFDQMMKLATENPDHFEKMRQYLVSKLIDSAPKVHTRKLRGLQWKIDTIRKNKPNAMSACIAINQLMWKSLHELNRKQEEFLSPTLSTTTDNTTPDQQFTEKQSAEIIQFVPRSND